VKHRRLRDEVWLIQRECTRLDLANTDMSSEICARRKKRELSDVREGRKY
jgi:hypothetical protein